MAVAHQTKCPSCGGSHNLCRPNADKFDSSSQYEYTCPPTQALVRLRINAFEKVLSERPEGSVEVCVIPPFRA
jgi:hypothetical protein